MVESTVRVENLTKWFPVRGGFFETLFSKQQLYVHAVDDISFEVRKGEVFGLAGESGSGKTTTGRLVLRLIEPTSGRIFFKGMDITNLNEKEMKPLRQKMQIVFQDPYESLNPRMTIRDIVAEPLRVNNVLSSENELEERVKEILGLVELVPPEEFIYRFPHELSGGQRQRVSVARGFTLNPDFVVADEPVSMLDVSIRAGILNMMLDLVEKLQVSFLYITHDLALARHMCDRIAIMYLGQIVEEGTTDDIVNEPIHPYTKALISMVPEPDPTAKRTETVIKGEIPSPVNVPSGCRFHTRCPVAKPECSIKIPELVRVGKDHYVACN